MSKLALSDSFEYIWYGSTAITDLFNFFNRGAVFRLQNLTSIVYSGQVQTSNVGPRAERVNKDKIQGLFQGPQEHFF